MKMLNTSRQVSSIDPHNQCCQHFRYTVGQHQITRRHHQYFCSNLSKSRFYHIRVLNHIRPAITENVVRDGSLLTVVLITPSMFFLVPRLPKAQETAKTP